MTPVPLGFTSSLATEWCVTVDTSGRQTTRTGHYYQRRDGVWTCANCGATK